jgi:hypothetical protein
MPNQKIASLWRSSSLENTLGFGLILGMPLTDYGNLAALPSRNP